jgi:hypothetical protein
LIEYDSRVCKDRRMQPTPALSRFTFYGRRRTFRRKDDQGRGGYVEQYHSGLLLLLILPIGLTVLDALFTMMIIDNGGWEVNPVVRSAIQLFVDKFWVWKFAIASIPLVLLCIHSKFRLVVPALKIITALNIVVVSYQVLLFVY